MRADTPSASAVSSIERPPKKRSSTTWALRGSSSGEQLERHVDGEQVGARLARRDVDAVERHADRVRTAAPLGAPPARDVDEHAPHHPGRDAEEVPAVLPADRIPAEQAQAQLVDQRRRLKADARSLADQVAGRHAVQLLVDERQHALERVRIAVAPGAEQLRDLAAVRLVWWSAHAQDPGRV